MNEPIVFKAIGYVENDFDEPGARKTMEAAESRIVLDPALIEGLAGLESGQRLAVIFNFHRSKGFDLLSEKYIGVKFRYRRIDHLELSTEEEKNLLDMMKILDSIPNECKEGIAGNISCCSKDGFLITTTGSELSRIDIMNNFVFTFFLNLF